MEWNLIGKTKHGIRVIHHHIKMIHCVLITLEYEQKSFLLSLMAALVIIALVPIALWIAQLFLSMKENIMIKNVMSIYIPTINRQNIVQNILKITIAQSTVGSEEDPGF